MRSESTLKTKNGLHDFCRFFLGWWDHMSRISTICATTEPWPGAGHGTREARGDAGRTAPRVWVDQAELLDWALPYRNRAFPPR